MSVTVHVVSFPAWRAALAPTRAARRLRAAADVRFFLCGRTSAGTGLRNISRSLSARRLFVLVEWAGEDEAIAGRAELDRWWTGTAASVWSASLAPLSATGAWNGTEALRPPESSERRGGLIASLTCARIRPVHLVDFYVRSFPKTARRARDPETGMIAGLGFGGAIPLRDACTISFWPSSAEVTAFAYRDAPHDPVRRASLEQRWLSESLFARFAVVDHGGTWAGGDPLA